MLLVFSIEPNYVFVIFDVRYVNYNKILLAPLIAILSFQYLIPEKEQNFMRQNKSHLTWKQFFSERLTTEKYWATEMTILIFCNTIDEFAFIYYTLV